MEVNLESVSWVYSDDEEFAMGRGASLFTMTQSSKVSEMLNGSEASICDSPKACDIISALTLFPTNIKA